MIISSIDTVEFDHPDWAEYWSRLKNSKTLAAMVWQGLQIGLLFARIAVESELATRAQAPTAWSDCPVCHRRYRSKGMVSRTLNTLIGQIRWSRRVGRCPTGCSGSLSVPLDQALGLAPHQRTGDGLKRLGCLLCVFLPYGLASCLLAQWSGIRVSDTSLWNWVEQMGERAMGNLNASVSAYSQTGEAMPESLAQTVAQLRLAIGADGVMVPFRPTPGTAKGKTQWREVKIGVFARLGERLTRSGQSVGQLLHRRVVAHLGDIDSFAPLMRWQATRQSIESAPEAIWLSDGGKGFWRLFRQQFAPLNVVGILVFYHASGHLWKAASTLFDGRTTEAKEWFSSWRHLLRHGGHQQVLTQLTQLINTDHLFSDTELEALRQVHSYLQAHHDHIRYGRFDKQGYPLGSGMVESACKWLIQQRFKGVGMRWSEDGFKHLCILRVCVVNQTFDDLFPSVNWAEQLPSPMV